LGDAAEMVSGCRYQELRILTNVFNLAAEDVQKKICKIEEQDLNIL
jgi:hypothetical protein